MSYITTYLYSSQVIWPARCSGERMGDAQFNGVAFGSRSDERGCFISQRPDDYVMRLVRQANAEFFYHHKNGDP